MQDDAKSDDAMFEGQNRTHLRSLAQLERQLRHAKEVFEKGKDYRRTGANLAILAAADFVRSIDEFKRDGLALPLFAVMTALSDLDEGAKLHPILEPKPARGARPDIMERQALREMSAASRRGGCPWRRRDALSFGCRSSR